MRFSLLYLTNADYRPVLLLMSLYLDKATLPSPCWMICGAMARVCQDIGLHRQPPVGRFTNVHMESRARIFWVAYIQDKRVSMKMGRPCILRKEDCDVAYPGVADSSGIDTTFPIPEISVSGLDEGSPEMPAHSHVTTRALETMRATINACKVIETILGHSVLPRDGTEKQMRKLQQLDDELGECWNSMPAELIDPQINKPIDLPAIRGELHYANLKITYSFNA